MVNYSIFISVEDKSVLTEVHLEKDNETSTNAENGNILMFV